jgi:tetrahydromethanopterin S-methyltransferase subunit B
MPRQALWAVLTLMVSVPGMLGAYGHDTTLDWTMYGIWIGLTLGFIAVTINDRLENK